MTQVNKVNRIKSLLSAIFLSCSLLTYGQTKVASADTLQNIRIREVIVTATQSDDPGSRSVIGQDAIRHIQATNLSDLSQLLPGVLTRNPNLNTPAAFTIRSATYDNGTNALGTAILIDGLRMSNNANMQQMGLATGGSLFNSSVLSGFDVRSISPVSIESVEVIRGIPSARYGDMTSGMVLVNSKAGIQPYTVGIRLTATEKLASMGKGMALNKFGSTLYLGADYALSVQDPRLPEQTFHRIGIQAAYAKDFTSATLRLNLRGYWTQDKNGRGANTVEGEFQKTQNQDVSFSANGQWTLNKPWITHLEYHAGGSYGQQRNEASTYYSGVQQITTYTQQAGEQEAIFLPPNYFTQITVTGKPLNANASLTAHLRNTLYNKVYNHLQLGLEAGTEGNRGEGIRFDPLRPPIEMREVRTRSYRDIPFVHHYAAFVENKIVFYIGGKRTELQAGVRVNQLQTKSLRYHPTIDPRINVKQVLISSTENALINHLSLRAGWGLMRKMPVLAYLYPYKSYTDKNSFTYNDMENGHRLAVMYTFITDDTFNPELRMPVNRKFELGVNFRIARVTADIVWFSEYLRNGYCSSWQAEPFAYRHYDPLTTAGERPELTTNGVVNKGTPLAYTSNTTFATYMRPQNGIEQRKQGIEYTIDLGHFQPLHSSLLISGGYLKVNEVNTSLSAIHPGIEVNGKPYPYVGIYETDNFITNLRVWQQFNTRFQCTTQLPRIGLITSLTLQAVWIDKQRRGMESHYNNPVYLADANGNRIAGDPATDTAHRKRLNPVYYLDGDGNRHSFTRDMETDKRFSDLILDANSLTSFQTDSFGPYFLLNLRVTKQIGKHVSVAFCANNLTQSKPKRYTHSTQQYTTLNPDLYYGAEVTVRF